ncbi:MAG TPA: HD domain-containing phosphohydrolase, partial [Thermoanaerobaculia bacterium]
VVLAEALRLPPGEIEVLRHAIPMHDVGKIGIPDAVLLKPGRLTPEERLVMESHAVIGGRILAGSSSPLLQAGETIALTHHERWDGTGYPRRLAGEDIPLGGRLCALVDVYDALSSDRPYRPALPESETLALMRDGRGTQFDPDLFDLFLEHLARLREVRAALPAPAPVPAL